MTLRSQPRRSVLKDFHKRRLEFNPTEGLNIEQNVTPEKDRMFRPLSLSLAYACSGNVNSSAPPPLRVHSLCSETASRRDNRIRGGLGRTLRMFSRSVPCPKSVQLAFLFRGTVFSPYACLESSLKQLPCTALTQLPSGCALSEQEKPFKQKCSPLKKQSLGTTDCQGDHIFVRK